MTSDTPPEKTPVPLHRIPLSRYLWSHRGSKKKPPCITNRLHARWMVANQHRHGYREMMTVLEGSHFYGKRDEVFAAEPGSVFLFEPQEPHDGFYSRYHSDSRDLWVAFSSPGQALVNEVVIRQPRQKVARNADVSFRRHFILAGPFVEAVRDSWDRFDRVESDEGAVLQLQASVIALLLHILSRLNDEKVSKPREASRLVVNSIVEYITRHPGDDLSVGTLARLAGYAPTYFHSMFREVTGEKLRVFVNRIRLEKAKDLLRGGNSVQSVAEDLGFGTPAYFSRFFRQATGMPPVRWKS